MSVKHNYMSVITSESMKEFIEQTFRIDVEFVKPMIDEDLGKMFICVSKQNLAEYVGEDTNWCMFDAFNVFGIVEKRKPYKNNFKFAELKPHLFKQYILFIAKQNIIDDEPVKIEGLTYGDRFIRNFAKYIEQKPNNIFQEFFGKKPTKKDSLTDLLVELDQEIAEIEHKNYDEPVL